jgi:hypothetical protein
MNVQDKRLIKPIKRISRVFRDKYKEDEQFKELIKKLMQGRKVDVII